MRASASDLHGIELAALASRYAGTRLHIVDFRWTESKEGEGKAEVMVQYTVYPSDEVLTQYFTLEPGIARRVREQCSLRGKK
jgi:hypothetical protein